MLFKAGFKHLSEGSIGDNELRYVLWRSYQNMVEPGRNAGFEWEAKDIAMQDSGWKGSKDRPKKRSFT